MIHAVRYHASILCEAFYREVLVDHGKMSCRRYPVHRPIWSHLGGFQCSSCACCSFSSGERSLTRNVCTKGLPATSGVHQLCLGRPAQKSKLVRAALLLDIEYLQHLVAEVVYDLHGDLTGSGLVEWATHRAVEALPRRFVNVSA